MSATLGEDQAAERRSPASPILRSAPRLGDPARIWWLNPAALLFFIILPIFGSAILLASPIMAKFGAYNFLTTGPIILAIGALAALATGTIGGGYVAQTFSVTRLPSASRIVTIICALALISIVAHIMLLGSILSNPSVAVSVLSGHRGAIYTAKALMNQIPGVTSFTQLFLLALPLYGLLPHLTKRGPPVWLRNIVAILLVLLVLRAFLTAERFTIIEAAIALIVPRLAFSIKIPAFTNLLPLMGFVAVFALFCVGEYTRSWPYYRYEYDSFYSFAYIRLIGYLATAANNGAGLLETSGPIYAPLYTANWFHSLPIWSFVDNPIRPENPLVIFFQTYGNSEFNNPGGLLSPIIDFGVYGGMLVHLMFGAFTGSMYALFRRGHILAVMLFPIFFLGMMIINQAYYWTNARVFLPVIFAVPIYFYVTRNRQSAR